MTSQHHPATPTSNKDTRQHATVTAKRLNHHHPSEAPATWERAARRITQIRRDDIGLSAMLAAVVAGTVALVARLAGLSRDVDAHARQVAKLWNETDDIRAKLLDVGEDFVQAVSLPPRPGGDRR